MSGHVYKWKRFWCPREGKISLSDRGYLYYPASALGEFYKADLVPFRHIADVPCLVLLGEPGIGKTTTIETEIEHIKPMIRTKGDQILRFDLLPYGSEDRLIDDLFQSSTFSSWIEGKNRLHFFLDSLDECLLQINHLSSILIHEFEKCPVERFYLRVVCRTAEWPSFLEKGLRKIWGNDAVKVYELAPLRRVDVVEAAEANDLDPVKFLGEIDHKEAVPLAIKPITLNFLLNTYRREGQLPSTQLELYSHGCRLLCKEVSESRIDARRKGDLTGEQRMTIASRIAAVTVFSNRYAIWTAIDQGDVPDEDVTILELCSGFEEVNDQRISVDEETLTETLNTGLFSSRGLNRIGWAHQTYAEFLAAHYLVRNELTLTQIMSLITHPGDPEKKVVPQLRGTAFWLAVMIPEVFFEIVNTDPEVLLRSDVITTDLKSRRVLTESLLRLSDEGRILYLDPNTYEHFKKLDYPELPDHIRPYICDRRKKAHVRRIAIEIAEACKLQVLENDIVNIALDPSEPLEVRTGAAEATADFASNKAKARMKPLVEADNPFDELKGYGLLALWPNHITAEELFSLLTPPKSGQPIGSYHYFILKHVVDNIDPADLPCALRWVEKQESAPRVCFGFEKAGDQLILRAWNYFGTPGVIEAFAKALLARLRKFKPIIRDSLDESTRNVLMGNDEKRHQILETIIPMLEDLEEDSARLVHSNTPIILDRDIPWMIEQLKKSNSDGIQRVWADLIKRVFNWRDPTHLNTIFAASQDNPILYEAFSWLLKPVELNSKEAQKMKEDYLRRQKILERVRRRPLLDPSPAERISLLLSEYESGDFEAWWRLNMAMTLEPDSTRYGNELESDLTALPGWKNAEKTTRRRIVEAARRYLFEKDPQTEVWLGTNKLYRPAFAGFRALRLLFQEDAAFLSSLPTDVWRKWAPIILAYPTSTEGKDEEIQKKIVKMAYQYARDDIIDTLMILIDKQDAEGGHVFAVNMIENCWDRLLAEALLSKVKDEKLKPESVGGLLGILLKHGIEEAEEFAESLIPLPPPSNGVERSKALVAAEMLMRYAHDAGWSVVWPVVQQDVRFGREVISALALPEWHIGKMEPQLTEEQLADLYIWIVRQYPYEEDPEHEGAYIVGPREAIADFRDSILKYLKNLGTVQGCKAIQHIIQEFPELEFLKWVLLEARNLTRMKTWTPPRPASILKIARNRGVHLVQNGEQLMNVLIESLTRLETKLQGETSAAIDLWNEIGRGKYRPKDESRFSDYAKRHLEEDIKEKGIIVNREVEIRHGEGSGLGEKTDIHVDAVIRDKNREIYDSITVIIEVKGCWHKELKQAMKTQLVDRYLKDNRCQYGLYLVGWFDCAQWDNEDYRKAQVPKLTIDQAQELFDAQAVELSQQGKHIKALCINTALR